MNGDRILNAEPLIDLSHQITTIQRVTYYPKENAYEIMHNDCICFYLTAIRNQKNIVPKVGDVVIFYNNKKWNAFSEVDGLQINGQMVFYISPLQRRIEWQIWIEETNKWYKEEYEKLMGEIKDEEPFETGDISGFGGGYERAVQLGLMAGIKWLDAHPDFKFNVKSYRGVYGIAEIDAMGLPEYKKMAEELDEAISKATNDDLTGAMHQAIITHLFHIRQMGKEEWLKRFKPENRYTYPLGLPPPHYL